MSNKSGQHNANIPAEKASTSTGSRGESSVARNESGNHNGSVNRTGKTPKTPAKKG